jgi:hypothetical protein
MAESNHPERQGARAIISGKAGFPLPATRKV